METVEKQSPKKSAKLFWIAFWTVIIILAALYLYITYLKLNKIVVHNGKPAISLEYAKEWEEKIPELKKIKNIEINETTKSKIHKEIDAHIDQVFEPVYGQVEKFADFHYSLEGEYTVLAGIFIGDGASNLQKILFDDISFEKNFNTMANQLSLKSTSILEESLSNIRNKLQTSMSFSSGDMNLLTKAFTLTINDVRTRFNAELTGLRAGGAVVAGGLVASKVAAKKIGQKMMLKVGAKAAAKTSAKTIGLGSGAGAGALACSWLGPLGMAVCGGAAAIAAWLITDKIILEVDELWNRDEFESDIRSLIDEQKNEMKNNLKAEYNKFLNALSNNIGDSIDKLKTPAELATQ